MDPHTFWEGMWIHRDCFLYIFNMFHVKPLLGIIHSSNHSVVGRVDRGRVFASAWEPLKMPDRPVRNSGAEAPGVVGRVCFFRTKLDECETLHGIWS